MVRQFKLLKKKGYKHKHKPHSYETQWWFYQQCTVLIPNHTNIPDNLEPLKTKSKLQNALFKMWVLKNTQILKKRSWKMLRKLLQCLCRHDAAPDCSLHQCHVVPSTIKSMHNVGHECAWITIADKLLALRVHRYSRYSRHSFGIPCLLIYLFFCSSYTKYQNLWWEYVPL